MDVEGVSAPVKTSRLAPAELEEESEPLEALEALHEAAAADAVVDEGLDAPREAADAAAEVDEVVEALLSADDALEPLPPGLALSEGVDVCREAEATEVLQLLRLRRLNKPV